MGNESKALENFYVQLNRNNPGLANKYTNMNNGYSYYSDKRTPEEIRQGMFKAGSANQYNGTSPSGSPTNSPSGSPSNYSSTLGLFRN